MRLNLSLKDNRVKFQLFFMLIFIFLTILMMIQQEKNREMFTRHLTTDKSVFCVSEVCLGQQCLEVPGRPVLGKLLIISSFDDKEVKHIKVIIYKDKFCGIDREK